MYDMNVGKGKKMEYNVFHVNFQETELIYMMQKKQETTLNRELFDFIEKSPTAFHACHAASELLRKNGAQELRENQKYDLKPGNTYYVLRNDSSLIAFRIPQNPSEGFHIIVSHSDSPTFKLKENFELESKGYITLNVEKYGGMLMAPWFDRPLSIAGRVVTENGNKIESRLIHFNEDLVMIPNLAIHMNRDVNNGYKYNAQKDMMPIWGDENSKGLLKKRIAETLEIEEDQILGTDLFLYNHQKGTIWGARGEYISAPRLDDLQCAFGSLKGFLESEEGDGIAVCAIFDNEETGSLSKQGASSTFLQDTLLRIADSLSWNREDYLRVLQDSFMISADNAHAVHPNYMETADAGNRPYMNKGIVLKYNAAQKYTTDAVSAAVLKKLCRSANIPVQVFANRSDLPGGSTLGNLSNAQVSLNTVDIGLPQLAMHSPYETAGTEDLVHMVSLAKIFYRSSIKMEENGQYCIKTDF